MVEKSNSKDEEKSDRSVSEAPVDRMINGKKKKDLKIIKK